MFDALADILSRSAVAYEATVVSTLPNDGLYGSVTTSLVISGWACGLTLNVSVTGAIVVRLLWIGRSLASLTATSTNRFASSIYLIIESGAITAVTSTSVVAILASNSPASLSGLDVACQLHVWVHLLIPPVRACTELLGIGRY